MKKSKSESKSLNKSLIRSDDKSNRSYDFTRALKEDFMIILSYTASTSLFVILVFTVIYIGFPDFAESFIGLPSYFPENSFLNKVLYFAINSINNLFTYIFLTIIGIVSYLGAQQFEVELAETGEESDYREKASVFVESEEAEGSGIPRKLKPVEEKGLKKGGGKAAEVSPVSPVESVAAEVPVVSVTSGVPVVSITSDGSDGFDSSCVSVIPGTVSSEIVDDAVDSAGDNVSDKSAVSGISVVPLVPVVSVIEKDGRSTELDSVEVSMVKDSVRDGDPVIEIVGDSEVRKSEVAGQNSEESGSSDGGAGDGVDRSGGEVDSGSLSEVGPE